MMLAAVAGLVLLSLACAVLALLLARQRRSLARVIRRLRALDGGRPSVPADGARRASGGELLRLFNVLAPRLEERLDRLERDRQLLEAVLEGMTEGVVAVDSRRRLLFANRAANRVFGLTSIDIGRLVAEVVRIPQFQQAIEASLRGPRPHQEELQVFVRGEGRRGGANLVLGVHGTRLPGTPLPGAVLVFRDVTELRRLERMRQDFVANASHELKTPLASIRAYTETLLDGALDDPEVNLGFLRRIEEQADRLDRLVRDMLSLARLESGAEAFRHEPLALAPAVRQIVEAHRGRAESRGQRLECRVDEPAASAMVRADEEALRQILDNLIDNALKYTPEGGRILVQVRSPGEVVVLEVADTGIGIPPDQLARVFERFYRVDAARSRALGGTGLGLSIVKHLAQSLGGRVAVESRVGTGSTFRVWLPRYQETAH